MGRSALVTLAAALFAGRGAALATPMTLLATQDPDLASTFTLNFGDYGESSANISTTTYQLAIDADAGTAQFLSYLQTIPPLLLPGGYSTGDITVEIVPGSSSGAYEPATGGFTTTDAYRIHFTGDLSLFGLTSPVELPSASSGQITFLTPDTGTIVQNWAGAGQIVNPFDPDNPISFTYACLVHTEFVPEPAALGLLAAGGLALLRRRRS